MFSLKPLYFFTWTLQQILIVEIYIHKLYISCFASVFRHQIQIKQENEKKHKCTHKQQINPPPLSRTRNDSSMNIHLNWLFASCLWTLLLPVWSSSEHWLDSTHKVHKYCKFTCCNTKIFLSWCSQDNNYFPLLQLRYKQAPWAPQTSC